MATGPCRYERDYTLEPVAEETLHPPEPSEAAVLRAVF